MSYNPVPVPDGSVTAAKLADNSVTAPKLADAAVNTDKLGGDVTTAAKTFLQAATAPAQRAVVELPNVLTQTRLA